MHRDERTQSLFHTIASSVFVSAKNEIIIPSGNGTPKTDGWLFDFRRVLFEKDTLNTLSALFWEHFTNTSQYQVGGLEVAAIPLVTAFSLNSTQYGAHAPGFFIRKSRKKDGLLRMIEGTVHPDKKIILVDDILNSGKSFIRQVEVLEELGHTVHAVWAVLRFRDEAFYEYFHKKNIAIHSIFSLNDFSESLGVKNITPKERTPTPVPYTVQWKFASKDPNYAYVVPKSNPTIDEDTLYVGSDSGVFWALNQNDGSTAWSFKVGFHARGKSIFSSPVISNDTVFFGAYDGNVYALNKKTGKPRWVFFEADHIGSSPALNTTHTRLFVGLERGLMWKRGGIACLDAQTGTKMWEFPMKAYTHSSPLYISDYNQVIVGGNEGIVYMLNASTGDLVWEFKTGEATNEELARGFSRYDIKESFAYDAHHDYIVFGNAEGYLFVLRRRDGTLVHRFKAEFGFYSTPCVYKDTVIATSLDKHVYCISLQTGKELWRYNAGARIFASPTIIHDTLYIGANNGRLTELDPATGAELSFLTVPERITNKVVYNESTKRFFVPTFANEIYCLEKHDTRKS